MMGANWKIWATVQEPGHSTSTHAITRMTREEAFEYAAGAIHTAAAYGWKTAIVIYRDEWPVQIFKMGVEG